LFTEALNLSADLFFYSSSSCRFSCSPSFQLLLERRLPNDVRLWERPSSAEETREFDVHFRTMVGLDVWKEERGLKQSANG
jgi:hypothetical protein